MNFPFEDELRKSAGIVVVPVALLAASQWWEVVLDCSSLLHQSIDIALSPSCQPAFQYRNTVVRSRSPLRFLEKKRTSHHGCGEGHWLKGKALCICSEKRGKLTEEILSNVSGRDNKNIPPPVCYFCICALYNVYEVHAIVNAPVKTRIRHLPVVR